MVEDLIQRENARLAPRGLEWRRGVKSDVFTSFPVVLTRTATRAAWETANPHRRHLLREKLSLEQWVIIHRAIQSGDLQAQKEVEDSIQAAFRDEQHELELGPITAIAQWQAMDAAVAVAPLQQVMRDEGAAPLFVGQPQRFGDGAISAAEQWRAEGQDFSP